MISAYPSRFLYPLSKRPMERMRKMKKNSTIRATRSSYVHPLVFCGHFHKETPAEHDHFLVLKLGIFLYDIVPSALSTILVRMFL